MTIRDTNDSAHIVHVTRMARRQLSAALDYQSLPKGARKALESAKALLTEAIARGTELNERIGERVTDALADDPPKLQQSARKFECFREFATEKEANKFEDRAKTYADDAHGAQLWTGRYRVYATVTERVMRRLGMQASPQSVT